MENPYSYYSLSEDRMRVIDTYAQEVEAEIVSIQRKRVRRGLKKEKYGKLLTAAITTVLKDCPNESYIETDGNVRSCLGIRGAVSGAKRKAAQERMLKENQSVPPLKKSKKQPSREEVRQKRSVASARFQLSVAWQEQFLIGTLVPDNHYRPTRKYYVEFLRRFKKLTGASYEAKPVKMSKGELVVDLSRPAASQLVMGSMLDEADQICGEDQHGRPSFEMGGKMPKRRKLRPSDHINEALLL